MQNRVPVAREARPALPDFDPVPRQYYRHDGWTPERQKAFIEALADTGSVTRAAALVNMAQANCYTIRRAPGAESFRRAWEAALDFGVQRLKDIAFDRAIDGQMVPVFVAGRLMGFRRKTNDALLMFCLRHYGQDAGGKRTTVNYFSTRAEAGAISGAGSESGSGGAVAQASASVETVVATSGGGREDRLARDDELATVIGGFEGVALDSEAQAAIEAALVACAERRREADAVIDAGGTDSLAQEMVDSAIPFVSLHEKADPFWGIFEPSATCEDYVPFVEGEAPWRQAGAEVPAMYRDMEGVADVKRPKPRDNWARKAAIASDTAAIECGDGDAPEPCSDIG